MYFDEMRLLSTTEATALVFGLVLAIAGAVGMGLVGYFSEQPFLLANPPLNRGQLDVENNNRIGTKTSNTQQQSRTNASPEKTVGSDEEGPLEVTGRLEGLSSPVWRESKIVPSALGVALQTELTKIAVRQQHAR